MDWSEDDNQSCGRPAIARYHGKYAGVVTDNGPPSSGSHRGQVSADVPGILEETSDGSSNQPLKVFAAPAFPKRDLTVEVAELGTTAEGFRSLAFEARSGGSVCIRHGRAEVEMP